jgi:hypothetical protein
MMLFRRGNIKKSTHRTPLIWHPTQSLISHASETSIHCCGSQSMYDEPLFEEL